MKKITIKDIAEELGVSRALVSFVMNGKAEEMRVSRVMEEKVKRKAKELGYMANRTAKALRTGKSNTIGLIVADISNSFFSKLAKSIEIEAMKNGYDVIFGSSDEDSLKSSNLINVFIERNVDGLIICATEGDQEWVNKLHERKIPFVLVDRFFHDLEANTVVVDNYMGSYEIVQRLIGKGIKKIAYVSINEWLPHMKDRLLGYKNALKANGISYEASLVKNVSFDNIVEDTEVAVKELINNIKDLELIYFGNYFLTLLGTKVLREMNKKNLSGVLTSSFGNHLFMELMEDIPLVRGIQPIGPMGKQAVQLILKQIKSSVFLNEKIILPLDIVEIG
ncbi:LacI family DNA-binding transcriptional regulator [Flagellimonas onchidii]|uniref:LacI family DNA-binding transcriptional regulator n=1 Tax=Flagellimonas onchidii TaxID=2562684 RepID=UPI0010A65928|nr:LacI family DNA-binding transcriptional regulator [Allomuricauda onchidii]